MNKYPNITIFKKQTNMNKQIFVQNMIQISKYSYIRPGIPEYDFNF